MSDSNEPRLERLLADHLRHSDAIRAGMAAKNRAGFPTRPVPLGYAKVRREDGGVSVVVDEAAALVREAFRLAGLKRQSLRKILAQLAGRSFVSKHGQPLSATALSRILTNEFYVGTVTYGGERAVGWHECQTPFRTGCPANLMKAEQGSGFLLSTRMLAER